MLNPECKIAFVGGGNMAEAMISGLIKSGHRSTNILVCAPSTSTRELLADRHSVCVTANNKDAVAFADVIILAVKPHDVLEVSLDLSSAMNALNSKPLIISVAAGVSWKLISELLDGSESVVCAMPNLASSLGKGLIGMYMPITARQEDIALANSVMRAIGKTVWVDNEELMSALVAAAGSAPAYFFLFMEAMEKEAMKQGLPKKVAKDAVLQTALGAITMAEQSDESFTQLRQRVTSPRGTTAEAIKALKENQFDSVVAEAMRSAASKADELYSTY